MAYSRYDKRPTFINDDLNYRDTFFVDRDVKQIEQYGTAKNVYPSAREIGSLEITPFLWKSTSRLFKLADVYYGRPELWWIIAWFNKKPTDAHYEVGEIINIPQPLAQVMYLYEKATRG